MEILTTHCPPLVHYFVMQIQRICIFENGHKQRAVPSPTRLKYQTDVVTMSCYTFNFISLANYKTEICINVRCTSMNVNLPLACRSFIQLGWHGYTFPKSVEKDFITCIAVDMLTCSLQAIKWGPITKLHEVQKENHLLAAPKMSAWVRSQEVDLRLLSYKLELEVGCQMCTLYFYFYRYLLIVILLLLILF